MMEVVSGDNWSYKTCNAPVKLSPTTNQRQVVDFKQCTCEICVAVCSGVAVFFVQDRRW